jgi:hypothetical protein
VIAYCQDRSPMSPKNNKLAIRDRKPHQFINKMSLT